MKKAIILLAVIASVSLAIAGEQNTKTQALNESARGYVSTGERVLIGGFIVKGKDFNILVIRAIGPELSGAGVAQTLADPSLTIYNQQTRQVMVHQDSYLENSSEDLQVLANNNLTPTDPRECAVVIRVEPGEYTAIVRGQTEGVALVEAYKVF